MMQPRPGYQASPVPYARPPVPPGPPGQGMVSSIEKNNEKEIGNRALCK